MALRKGMWVLHSGKVGILNALGPRQGDIARGEGSLYADEGEVHLVADDGSTTAILPVVKLSALAQAAFDNIPESRRPGEGMARALGYLH